MQLLAAPARVAGGSGGGDAEFAGGSGSGGTSAARPSGGASKPAAAPKKSNPDDFDDDIPF